MHFILKLQKSLYPAFKNLSLGIYLFINLRRQWQLPVLPGNCLPDVNYKQVPTGMFEMGVNSLNLLVLSLISFLHSTLAADPAYTLEYESPESCKSVNENGIGQHYYFNSTTLSCMPCTQNATYQTVTSDGLFV